MSKYNGQLLVDRIKELLKPKGTITQFERDLGMAKGHTYKFIDSAPSADRLILIADRFNVSIDYLLGRDSPIRKEIDDRVIDKLISETNNLEWRELEIGNPINKKIIRLLEKYPHCDYRAIFCEVEDGYAILLLIEPELSTERAMLKLLLLDEALGVPSEEFSSNDKITNLLEKAGPALYYRFSEHQNKALKERIIARL